jgi:KDO2-lipid IV(A) lauroyltransferase
MHVFQWQFLHPKFWLSWLGLFLMWLTIFIPARLQILLGTLINAISGPFLSNKRKIAAKKPGIMLSKLI